MKTPLTKPDILAAAVAALSTEKMPVTVINDSPGFVVQRLLAMIVNIGTRIAELRIAAPADIDTAVELGLNYPKGPLALGDVLGPGASSPCSMESRPITHDPKYRATTWLRRRAGWASSLSYAGLNARKKHVNSFICKWKTAFRAAQAGYDQGHAESPDRCGPCSTAPVPEQT